MPQKRTTIVRQAAWMAAGSVAIPHCNIDRSGPSLEDQVPGHEQYKYRAHASWGDQDHENIYVRQRNADQSYSIKLERI